ncbi:hypothetical protein L249_6651 [Ophiocordyceps polyrhachis-furcata BCC 54312]|uniref:Uncharacterized protein n=1 Tax=Ophiocordyceps polyrhachis-furcata BCC 54312 TaxID=1330021 RepID=A0A367LKX6_9HYPO|nr:hypothetical protein L249_6651 [Ophiocordyceps polyrhachis-furcata BCC 54312]
MSIVARLRVFSFLIAPISPPPPPVQVNFVSGKGNLGRVKGASLSIFISRYMYPSVAATRLSCLIELDLILEPKPSLTAGRCRLPTSLLSPSLVRVSTSVPPKFYPGGHVRIVTPSKDRRLASTSSGANVAEALF